MYDAHQRQQIIKEKTIVLVKKMFLSVWTVIIVIVIIVGDS